jgi:hypothetical protein
MPEKGGLYPEGRYARIGLCLAGPAPENPRKSPGLGSRGKYALKSPGMPKYRRKRPLITHAKGLFFRVFFAPYVNPSGPPIPCRNENVRVGFFRGCRKNGVCIRREDTPVSGSVWPVRPRKPPANHPVWVPVENTPSNRPECQNTGGNDHSQRMPKAFFSGVFSPHTLTHPDPRFPAGMRM